MAIIGYALALTCTRRSPRADEANSSTIGQPSFYTSLDLAPQGEPGYAKTAEYIGAFNGVNAAGSAIGAAISAYTADKWVRPVVARRT